MTPTPNRPGRPRTWREWTVWEEQTLERLVSEGWSTKSIAEELGRTEKSVEDKRARLLPGDKDQTPWTVNEDNELKSRSENGESDDDIAAAIGRTVGAVEMRRRAFGLLHSTRGDEWTASETEQLMRYTMAGIPQKEIASLLGRSETAVEIKRGKLKIKHVLPTYVITTPVGESITVHSINQWCRENHGDDWRRASNGLQWALKTGRAWKNYRITRTEAGTRNRKRTI